MKKFLLFIPLLLLGACSVQFGGGKVNETLPPLTTTNTTIHEFNPPPTEAPLSNSVDENNDMFLSSLEYDLFYQTMDEMGYVNIIDIDSAQAVGEGACHDAARAVDQDQFITELTNSAIDNNIDVELMGNVVGALGAVMCNDELVRLGFGS